MRDSHKNIYRDYCKRNRSLFGDPDPYNKSASKKNKDIEDEKMYKVKMSNYRGQKFTTNIFARSAEMAKIKANDTKDVFVIDVEKA